MRQSKRFDSTKESLLDKSHKPFATHFNYHTNIEIKCINDYLRRNPNISLCELYDKLRCEKGYSRHTAYLFKFHRKKGIYTNKEKHSKYIPKHQDTPVDLGIKRQMVVKYIPKYCYVGSDKQKFYQYTMIDETSCEKFISPYKE